MSLAANWGASAHERRMALPATGCSPERPCVCIAP